MSVFRWPLVTLIVSYSIGVLACRWLIFQDFALDRPTVTAMIAVPLVQAAALAACRSLARRRSA
jgi:hypothetical protein